jgi:hypothetical protein
MRGEPISILCQCSTFDKPKYLGVTLSNDLLWNINNIAANANRILEAVDTPKNLCVTLSNDLLWNTNINNIVAKANRILGMLKRNISIRLPRTSNP